MDNIFLIKRNKLIVFLIAVALIFYLSYVRKNGSDINEIRVTASYVTLAITAYLTIVNRHNIVSFFIYFIITYFNYSFLYERFITNGNNSSGLDIFFNQVSNPNDLYTQSVAISLLFVISLLFFDNIWGVHRKNYRGYFDFEKNQPIIVCILLITVFMYRIVSMQAFEYGVINIAVAYAYSGNNKKSKYIIFIVSLILFIIGIFSGLRVPVLPYIICAIFMTFSDKINYKYMTIGIVVGVVFMTLMGIYGDMHGNYKLNVMDAIYKLKKSGCAIDTAQFAFMSSFLALKVKTFTSFSQILELLRQFVLSQFIGSGGFPYAKLVMYTYNFYVHYAGLVWQYAFFFYFGWFGVVFSGAYITGILYFTQRRSKNEAPFFKVVLGYFVAMIPKWFLYEPTSAFRGIFLLIIVYMCAKFLSMIIYKER